MRLRPLAAALLLLLSALPAAAADVVFPPGSIVGLVPPPDVEESHSFAGFENRAKGATLLIVDMPPEAFAELEAGFNDDNLADKGITVEKRASLPLPNAEGTKALLVTGWQQIGAVKVRKWVLLAGNETLTTLVTFQVPEAQAGAFPDAVIRASLASLAFRSTADQVAALPFTLTDLSGFRVVRTLGGTTVILTDGPKNIIEGAEQPYFVVAIGAGAPRDDDRRNFAVRALSALPGVRDMRIERSEPLRISKLPGYEIMAQGVDAKTGQPVKVVQWLRFAPTAHLRMVAVMPLSQFQDLYPRIRAIRDGVDGR